MSAIVVAVGNQKGGVGKTTTTVNLGHAFAASGVPTLIVDLDPQANATSALGFEKKPGAGIYGPITGNGSASEQVQATRSENLWILPSELDLAAAELELGGQPDYLLKLRECLATLKEDYGLSLILVDCPPTLGLLSMNALCAADYLLVTLQCEYLALEGLGQILGVVDQLRNSGANKDLQGGWHRNDDVRQPHTPFLRRMGRGGDALSSTHVQHGDSSLRPPQRSSQSRTDHF